MSRSDHHPELCRRKRRTEMTYTPRKRSGPTPESYRNPAFLPTSPGARAAALRGGALQSPWKDGLLPCPTPERITENDHQHATNRG